MAKAEEKVFDLTVTKKVKLTGQDIDDIMVCALEGGINYWCYGVKVVEQEIVDGKVEEKYLGEYASDQISRGGSLYLYDSESGEIYKLTLEKFLKGFALAAATVYNDRWINGDGNVDTFNIDGSGADAIIQCAIFGEVIYG